MGFYALKPMVVQAVQYTDPFSVEEIMDTFGTRGFNNSEEGLYVIIENAIHKANKTDWILRNHNGKIQIVPDDMFKLTYQSV